MADPRKSALKFANDNKERYLEELKDLLKIQSVSTDLTYKDGILKAAEWLKNKLNKIGMTTVEIMPTPGHPVVYAELLTASANTQTMLIYGHYDVQPPDPLELWESGPFEPTEKDGYLFARGGSDMKGPLMTTINAVEAALRNGDVPINIKILLEGEEETSSTNLEPFIKDHIDLLTCDFMLNPDSGMHTSNQPTITYALRGMAPFEITVFGPSKDVHSGMHGGTIRNPLNELSRLIGGMHDDKGRVTLPGFYDNVQELDEEERKELARFPEDQNEILKEIGAPGFWGEEGFTNLERKVARPTLDVNGIIGGYTGEGMKTIIPSNASAKISTRLVPHQTPDEVHQQLIQYLQENANPAITWEVKYKGGGNSAAISDRKSLPIQAMSKAQETVWGAKPIFNRIGGTIPVVGYFQELLKAESVSMGVSLPDDNIHSPNEKLLIDNWYKGIDAVIHFLYNLSS